ncbi:MAG: NosD domain-containing protein [Candidatus Thorarchaeota archaeon]
MVKKWVSLSFVSLLLFMTVLPIMNSIAISPTGVEKENSYYNYIIRVTSDDEFDDRYWIGNGTDEDPYVLIPKMFYGSYIEIRNTISHFVITDLIIEAHGDPNYTESGIFPLELSNVTNGVIVNSVIKAFLWPYGFPYDLDDITGIKIDNSSGIVVEDCMISDSGRGLWISDSSNTFVTGNQILRNSIGIDIDGSFNTTVFDNKIIENAEYGIRILEQSRNSSINGNYLGYNGVLNALDYENSTVWDEGTQGNYWDDYDESGVYNITGMGSNYDRFPQLLTQDVLPPDIELSPNYGWGPYTTVCVTAGPGPVTPSFDAMVIDESGIDSVYLCISAGIYLKWYEMTQSSESDVYTYTFTDDYYYFNELYYVWANDTEGNAWTSYLMKYYYEGYTTGSSTTPSSDGDIPFTYLTVGIFIALAVGVLVYICKARES